jgi:beta-glucosidase/6-phospho-beta-glucosidase/beta-galactosidase
LVTRAEREPLFEGVFLGGFECSCLRLDNGRRLDLLASTRHAELADADYARLRSLGMTACRDGLSWVATEPREGQFDFSRAIKMIEAADRQRVQVLWDLVHFGWPDDVDPYSAAFPRRVARYAAAFARIYKDHTDAQPWITPVNEMSFLSWAGSDVGVMNPFDLARGVEMKVQLVRATIEAIEAIRDVLPHARFVQPEPIIHIHPAPEHPLTWRRVEADNLLQFQAWDMLVGKVFPTLGGHPRYLDVVGINYYPNNQFMLDGKTIWRDDERHRPLSDLLVNVHERYGRPMFISETGTEGDARAEWLRYVSNECISAMGRGVELHGITLYPVLNHPGWVDDRHCPNGLWDYADDRGERAIHAPLAEEIAAQTGPLTEARARLLFGPDIAAA